jgi:transcriptional regulator with GAF, ATPase, and Fis domain
LEPDIPLRAYDSAAFARISQELLSEPAYELTLQRVVELAVESIEGCDYAGVTLRRGKKVETPAATDPLVIELDRAQYELNEGPCLDAVFVDDIYVIDDMTKEDRWPHWAPKAAARGIQSILSVRLATPKEVVGGLNLYSTATFAYDEDQILTAQIYATHASNAIAMTSQVDGLTTAMQNRHMIGMAQGILIQRYQLSEEQAFKFLARISNEANVKLRDVAAKVINETKANVQAPRER